MIAVFFYSKIAPKSFTYGEKIEFYIGAVDIEYIPIVDGKVTNYETNTTELNGLNINIKTGIISGVPIELKNVYVQIRACNGKYCTDKKVTIEINRI